MKSLLKPTPPIQSMHLMQACCAISAAYHFAIAPSLANGCPASTSLAALYTRSLAASSCVATCAIWCCMLWNPPMNIHDDSINNSPGTCRPAFRTASFPRCRESWRRNTLGRSRSSGHRFLCALRSRTRRRSCSPFRTRPRCWTPGLARCRK
jgi:hypothetical protein